MRPLYFLCFLIICISLFGCVEPKQFVALENRIAALEMENNRYRTQLKEISVTKEHQEKLEKTLASLEKKIDQGPDITQESYAEMKYDIQIIKEDLQKIEGRIQELKHVFSQSSQKETQSVDTQLDRLDQAISKNYEKILKLEKYMGFEPTVAGEQVVSPPPAGQEPGKNEALEQYNLAKKFFDDGDNENARIQFENFINKYPDSENADNARFWIADSYYVEKWYDKAILEYQKVLETYPDSNKLAAARLKQGYAFAELGEIANARLILKVLLQKHPNSDEAKYAKEKLKHLK